MQKRLNSKTPITYRGKYLLITKGVIEVIKAIEQNINKLLAKEFIENHLSVEPLDDHIERFANCISEIENGSTDLKRGNTP